MKRCSRFSRTLYFAATAFVAVLAVPPAVAGAQAPADAATVPSVQGLRDHGVAVPVSVSRGSFVVTTGEGQEKLLVNLLDTTGGYGILLIDPENGQSDFYPYPFAASQSRRGPFYSLYSERGLFYGLFNGHFFEFDPRKGEYTFTQETNDVDEIAMSMTEGDDGTIWLGLYPKAHLLAFDPVGRSLHDYGSLNAETWQQYPRLAATDDSGWVYLFIAFTRHQIIAFNPADGQVRALIPDADRTRGNGSVDGYANTHTQTGNGTLWRGQDGKVYARSPGNGPRDWFRLYQGNLERLAELPAVERRQELGDNQMTGAFHDFADGRKVEKLDLSHRSLTIRQTDGSLREVRFDYPSNGAFIYGLGLGPDGSIYGATGHPMHLFRYDPQADRLIYDTEVIEGGHINTFASQAGRIYGAIYTQGVLVGHDPAAAGQGGDTSLPVQQLDQAGNAIVMRPSVLLAYPDGERLVMTGFPGYGRTGGGMMIYNVSDGGKERLAGSNLIDNQSTTALAVLPDGNLIGGSSVKPGTGGSALASEAELYIMDWKTRRLLFHAPVLPGHIQYRELLPVGDEWVIGLADRGSVKNGKVAEAHAVTLFLFNWKTQKLVKSQRLPSDYGRIAGGQAPRVWQMAEDGMIYCLFRNALVRIDPLRFTHEKVAELPVDVLMGIAIKDGRIYFSSRSRLYSLELPLVTRGETSPPQRQ